MLAKRNRLVTAADYMSTVRAGRRRTAGTVVVYIRETSAGEAVRYGFIVSKSVGNAVVRNRVRRRLKSIAHRELTETSRSALSRGRSVAVVIRALPAAAQATWVTLEQDVSTGLRAVESLSPPRPSSSRVADPAGPDAASRTANE